MDENLAVALQEVKDRSLRNEGRIKKLEENQHALNDLALVIYVNLHCTPPYIQSRL